MSKHISCLIAFWVFCTTLSQAQDSPESSNLQVYTPSALFSKGQFEIQSFNSLYSQKQIRDREGDLVELGARQQFLNSLWQFTYGISDSKRINVGLDINIARAAYHTADANSLAIFGGNTVYDRTAFASIGPRIKFVPLPSVPRLSIQSTFWIPLAKDLEQPLFTTHDRYTWWTQIFFDRKVGEDFQLFLEASVLWRIARYHTQHGFFRTPLSAFFSYFPSNKATVYAFSQYSPAYGKLYENDIAISDFGRTRWFTQLGVGAKYQVSPKLGIELSYAHFIASKSDGAGGTLNLGVRFIK